MSGIIKPFWSAKDYKSGVYKVIKNPYNNFSTDPANKKRYKNVNVYANYDVPQKFYSLVEKFNIEKAVLVLNKMPPGQIFPFHVDKCRTYIKKNKIKTKEKIQRIIVFLDASEPGHQLWINDKLCVGGPGSFFQWSYGTRHMAANLGEKDRYTLQITGLKE
jgi:hypothetical protein